jgi:hypothetical protein
MPLPANTNSKTGREIEKFVNEILFMKAENINADTFALERQADNFVYRLYNLSHEEVKVIESEFPLNKMEYEKIYVRNRDT